MNKKLKITLIVVAAVLILMLTVIPFGISAFLYEQYFGTRYETYEPYTYSIEEFQGLERTKHQFESDRGQLLTGYLYYTSAETYKGIIVIAHGFGGGGHNSYMDCANYFAHSGYYVFAFDATGNDESEGESVGGLPQGVIDLSYAISYVESIDGLNNLPIMLFGHSWGGYAVTNVIKYHPEVKAVVTFSGFDRSSDLIESQGKTLVGDWVNLLMPYVNLYERMKFGDYSSNSAMDAFEETDTAVMVFHSTDDTVVLPEYGYDIWKNTYGNSNRFKFVEFSDKGHNSIYYSYEAMEWLEDVNEEFKSWANSLPYDITASENTERLERDKADWIKNNLDRERWCAQLDEDLFAEIVDFYDQHVK